MIDLHALSYVVDDVLYLRDQRDAAQIHYIPLRPSVRRDAQGTPKFTLVRWRPEDPADLTQRGGGNLSADLDLRVGEARLAAARGVLEPLLGVEGLRLVGVHAESVSIDLVVGPPGSQPLATGRPSPQPGMPASLTHRVGVHGAIALAGAIGARDGGVGAIYRAEVEVWRRPLAARLRLDAPSAWEQLRRDLPPVPLHLERLRPAVETLLEAGLAILECGEPAPAPDALRDRLVAFVLERLFEPVAAPPVPAPLEPGAPEPAAPPDPGQPAPVAQEPPPPQAHPVFAPLAFDGGWVLRRDPPVSAASLDLSVGGVGRVSFEPRATLGQMLPEAARADLVRDIELTSAFFAVLEVSVKPVVDWAADGVKALIVELEYPGDRAEGSAAEARTSLTFDPQDTGPKSFRARPTDPSRRPYRWRVTTVLESDSRWAGGRGLESEWATAEDPTLVVHLPTVLGMHPVRVVLPPQHAVGWPQVVVQLSYADEARGVYGDAVLRLDADTPEGTWCLRGVTPSQPTWTWKAMWRSAAGSTAMSSGSSTERELLLSPP